MLLSTKGRLTAVILMAVTDSNSLAASNLMGRDQLTFCPGCYVQSSKEAITKAVSVNSQGRRKQALSPR